MKYIQREIHPLIKQHLHAKEITLIIGPRQAGKTTLLKQIEKELITQGKKTLFLNLDIEADFQLLESQEKFLFALQTQIGRKHAFIFIDEFQRKQDGGRFIKGIYDMDVPYKFIITGSGSVELKEKIHESLAGRKRSFVLSTLSFSEFFNFKTQYKFKNKQKAFLQLYPDKMQFLLRNYLTFGGYPRVVTADTIMEKNLLLTEIFNSYLLKDIVGLLAIEKTEKFRKLVEALAVLEGKLINISQLSKIIGLSIPTVEKYLWYLENTFVIRKSHPFSTNPLKEITKSGIYYFYDLGLKNLISNNLRPPTLRTNLGFDFQTFVFNELHHKLINKGLLFFGFWRTKSKAEVDIILKRGNTLVGVETKYSKFHKPQYTRSIYNFIKKYHPKRFYIINKNLDFTDSINNTPVRFVTFAQLDEIVQDFY